MPVTSLPDWIAQYAQPEHIWFAKRLSANDTGQTKSNQVGPYLPKEFAFGILPALKREAERNPRVRLNAYIDSHMSGRQVDVIWYNGGLFRGTRNEVRLTRWGGRVSPMLDPKNTGALAVFVFVGAAVGVPETVRIWITDEFRYEDEVLEGRLGPIEPGTHLIWRPGDPIPLPGPSASTPNRLGVSRIPEEWKTKFPSAAEIALKAIDLAPLGGRSADDRLMGRRKREFEIFRVVERAVEGPKVTAGFEDLEEFLGLAQSVLQRRKSRSGRSLELQVRQILLEEGFVEGTDFNHGAKTEEGKKPDFLFPSEAAYADPTFPSGKLRMLAAKTTARDRWRQVLNEANRIGTKHLLTLQEGVSLAQMAEMKKANLQLVVPSRLLTKYPEAARPQLMTIEAFLSELRGLNP